MNTQLRRWMVVAVGLLLSHVSKIEAADCTMNCKNSKHPLNGCTLQLGGCKSCSVNDELCTWEAEDCYSKSWSGGEHCTST